MAAGAHAGICRVSTDGVASNSGDSWSTTKGLHDALNDVNCGEIWVKQGRYVPGASHTASFVVARDVAVYGGFAGTETAREQRDAQAHMTVLSGDIAGDDVAWNGITQSATDIRGRNSLHVVRMEGTVASSITPTTVLDGFTITGGDADQTGAGDPFPLGSGGGLRCTASGTGAGCSPRLSHLMFQGNRAGTMAGGLYVFAHDGAINTPHLEHVEFVSNRATNAGAVLNLAIGGTSNPRFENVFFTGNQASHTGGALYHLAGEGGTANGAVLDAVFVFNNALHGAAAVNDAQHGGSSSPEYSRVAFVDNTASTFGVMYNTAANGGTVMPSISNATFSQNTAGRGSAMYNWAGYGALNVTSPSLTHVTVVGNRNLMEVGSAIYNEHDVNGVVEPEIRNSILWGNGPVMLAEIRNVGAAAVPRIGSSIVRGSGGSGAGWRTALGQDLGSNVDADPRLFPLADNGGNTSTLMPMAGSPALDSADAAHCLPWDQRGVMRLIGAGCDTGAVERMGAVDGVYILISGFESPVVVPTLPPEMTFEASAGAVEPGQSLTLNWTTQQAQSCTASSSPHVAAWSGSKPVQGSQVLTFNAFDTFGMYVLTLTCSNVAGSAQQVRNVHVRPAPPVGGCDAYLNTLSPQDRATYDDWHGDARGFTGLNTTFLAETGSVLGQHQGLLQAALPGVLGDAEYLALSFTLPVAGGGNTGRFRVFFTEAFGGAMSHPIAASISPCPGDFRPRQPSSPDPFLSAACRTTYTMNGVLSGNTAAVAGYCKLPPGAVLYINVALRNLFQPGNVGSLPADICPNGVPCGVTVTLSN